MYLDPQNGKEPMFNAAVRLLHNHGESLDPLQVLKVFNQYCHCTNEKANAENMNLHTANLF